ncbi:Retinol dehydrogenase 11 [Pseudolycoriella hygida]|uniref:Retinol dehydrogenase 11 n=1 Tax=Pseudolycoriella hygida TaxID=35572 RepID=A0A9Q0MJD7_9DIPT|nr:Retinol dehydrogenase 11 [Pseudolycoriella hygida]
MLEKWAGLHLIVWAMILVRKYLCSKRCKCTANIENKLIIITGATSGIGLALAWELAKRGACLTLACRDFYKANNLARKIRHSTGNSKITAASLDLSSFECISTFAKTVIDSKKPVFALINNAGIFYAKPTRTPDGIEQTLQTNYLGPFLLTSLLLPALRKHDSSRIINISSEAHLAVQDFPQEEFHQVFEDSSQNRFIAYQYSKFCLTLFTYCLRESLRSDKVKLICVNPGNTETNIFRTFPQLSHPVAFAIQKPIRFFLVNTPHEGIQSILHGLLAKNPPFYIENLSEGQVNNLIYNPEFSLKLWRMSREMCQKYL